MRRAEIELEWYAMQVVEETLRGMGPSRYRCDEDVRRDMMEELVGTRWGRRRLRRWSWGEQGLREVMETDLEFGAGEFVKRRPVRRPPAKRRKR